MLKQNKDIWTKEWEGRTPETEIQMWDYYGLRPWILKYTPRYGKVLEAGCGLGRYNFYLNEFGIDIDGLDFSEKTITFLNNWKKTKNLATNFISGDVCNLPYNNSSISGYLSFGVIEHFQEGPHEPLKEAFRVLRPGGVAIISTPSISWNTVRLIIKKKIKKSIKKVLFCNDSNVPFHQYEYRPNKLKRYVNKSGLRVTRFSGADLLYTFTEFNHFKGTNIYKGSLAYNFSKYFENTFFRNIGAQSVTVSIKLEEIMHCFLCGQMSANINSLKKYDIPLCDRCEKHKLATFYKKNKMVKFHSDYIVNPPKLKPKNRWCSFCQKNYQTSDLFESFGFNTDVCPSCLKDKEINILLSNKHIQPIWRQRNKT